MGQRHQAFLIARVRPHGAQPGEPGRRRCIAAFHHQWSFGSLPLLAMRRLITLVSQPENAAILRAEIQSINGQYGHGCEEPIIPDIPCPYAASLLGSAWTTDLEAGKEIYVSGWSLEGATLSASMGCWDGDNNDGISILDITEPDRPAYCFLQSKDVLDAYGYLTTYYPIPRRQLSLLGGSEDESSKMDGSAVEDESEMESNEEDESETESDMDDQQPSSSDDLLLMHRVRAIKSLEDVPVIFAALLREAWPYVSFRDSGRPSTSSSIMTEAATAHGPSIVPSLVDMTFSAVVKHSLETHDTSDLAQVLRLPGKAQDVKEILRGFDPFPDSGTELLVSVLSELNESARVDLSGFQLSGTQLVEVLSDCNELTFLDVSFNNVLAANDVPELLKAAPTLRRLVVIGCPSIVDADMLALVQHEPSRFKSVEGIIHPAFLTVEKPDSYPIAFTFASMGDSGLGHGALACTSVPFFTPAQVVQALIDALPWKDAQKNRDEKGSTYPMMGFSAFHAGVRAPGEKFGRRPVVSVPLQTSRIPRGQKDLWAFVVSRVSRQRPDKNVKDMWGFIHFTTREDERAEHSTEDAPTQRASQDRTGQLYDLRGFLECMASERRPMPSEAAVKELERILYKKHRETGEFYCPFMREEDVENILVSWL